MNPPWNFLYIMVGVNPPEQLPNSKGDMYDIWYWKCQPCSHKFNKHCLNLFDESGLPKMLLFLKVDMRGDVNIPPPTLLQLEIAVPEIHGSTGFPPIFIVFPWSTHVEYDHIKLGYIYIYNIV